MAATIFHLVLTHEEKASVNDASVETFTTVYYTRQIRPDVIWIKDSRWPGCSSLLCKTYLLISSIYFLVLAH